MDKIELFLLFGSYLDSSYVFYGKIKEFDFEVVEIEFIKLNKKERRHYFLIQIHTC